MGSDLKSQQSQPPEKLESVPKKGTIPLAWQKAALAMSEPAVCNVLINRLGGGYAEELATSISHAEGAASSKSHSSCPLVRSQLCLSLLLAVCLLTNWEEAME